MTGYYGGLGRCRWVCGPGLHVYSDVTGECVACPHGTYSNATDFASSCSVCPVEGMVTNGTGAASAVDCSCPPGRIADSGYCARDCGPGYARPSLESPCETCGTDTYSDVANLERCTRCPVGSGCPPLSDSVTDCVCKAGFYSPTGATGTACARCPDGATCKGGTEPPVSRPGEFAVFRCWCVALCVPCCSVGVSLCRYVFVGAFGCVVVANWCVRTWLGSWHKASCMGASCVRIPQPNSHSLTIIKHRLHTRRRGRVHCLHAAERVRWR